jgi:hypothetical protein
MALCFLHLALIGWFVMGQMNWGGGSIQPIYAERLMNFGWTFVLLDVIRTG